MNVHLQCLFVNTLFFVVGAHRRPKIMLPGSTTLLQFPRCSDAGDIVEGCLDRMTRFLAKSRRGHSKDIAHDKMKNFLQESADFHNCLLHRQELTLREYGAWCEHKSSVARKVAVCFRYLIDKHTQSISKSAVTKGIERLQDCILNEQDESVEDTTEDTTEELLRPKRNIYKRRKPIKVPQEKDEMEDPANFVVMEQEDDRPRTPSRWPKSNRKHNHRRSPGYVPHVPHRRPESEQPQGAYGGGLWSYPLHDQTYYYPRREKGLGNETTQSANKAAGTPPTTIHMLGPKTKPPATTPSATEPPATTRK
ncbi:uncharacterized protein LOC119450932 [Dermacentor silvarum]|uniref:uncharacterized protein LOC119450932 n=1 Tax=Dermacentor silvarum TaxID=543639 RepID=UPI002100B7E0|nr:uncharacterized protein LOC119450932 [Dermacentor silvarum]